MPTKRPASEWQPAGIELLDVSSLYGDAKIRELAEIIGSLRDEKRPLGLPCATSSDV